MMAEHSCRAKIESWWATSVEHSMYGVQLQLPNPEVFVQFDAIADRRFFAESLVRNSQVVDGRLDNYVPNEMLISSQRNALLSFRCLTGIQSQVDATSASLFPTW
jgi:hypothetical protein